MSTILGTAGPRERTQLSQRTLALSCSGLRLPPNVCLLISSIMAHHTMGAKLLQTFDQLDVTAFGLRARYQDSHCPSHYLVQEWPPDAEQLPRAPWVPAERLFAPPKVEGGGAPSLTLLPGEASKLFSGRDKGRGPPEERTIARARPPLAIGAMRARALIRATSS